MRVSEAIAKEYEALGFDFRQLDSFTDLDGWCLHHHISEFIQFDQSNFDNKSVFLKDIDNELLLWRPKNLRVIDYKVNWKKIQKAEDLPEMGLYDVKLRFTERYTVATLCRDLSPEDGFFYFSHYRPKLIIK